MRHNLQPYSAPDPECGTLATDGSRQVLIHSFIHFFYRKVGREIQQAKGQEEKTAGEIIDSFFFLLRVVKECLMDHTKG